jgi:Tfp pilus assembly protein PilO
MSLTDRDRKIALAIVPILLVVGCWFLLIAPKRKEAASAQTDLAKQQTRLTAAQATVDQASSAKNTFAADYTEVVRLGKAIPPAVDMPGLLVQLDRASKGTGIRFTKIAAGAQADVAPPAAAGATPSSGSQPPVAAGGAPAQSTPGTAAEKANNASATSDQANQAAGASGVSASDTQTSTTAGASGTTTTSPAGLKAVPLQLEFGGNFFNLADFFHRVKRLVRTANENVTVSGRLITIEGIHYTSDPKEFPKLKAEVKATVYLVPAGQGTTAGATPQGPSTTTPASTDQPAPAASPPAATVAPR